MQIELVLLCEEGPNGMAVNTAHQPLEFGAIKKSFRGYIDSKYDHHLVLNAEDPWAGYLMQVEGSAEELLLPGLVTVPGDPTTENLSKWIALWACENYRVDVVCTIEETATNGAESKCHWNSFGAKMIEGAV